MQVNPFVLSNKISGNYFFGREEECEKLVCCIKNKENVILTGHRRIGKTGLINHAFSTPEVGDTHYLISIEILHTSSIRELVLELVRESFKVVVSGNRQLMSMFSATMKSLGPCFGYDAQKDAPTFTVGLGSVEAPWVTMDELLRFLAFVPKSSVVAIEEFQQVSRYPEKDALKTIVEKMSAAVNTRFIISTSQAHKELAKMEAVSIELNPISLERYMEFSTSAFASAGKGIDPLAVGYVYGLFEGITVHIHRVLHDAFAATARGTNCTLDEVKEASAAYIHASGYRLRELLGSVSVQQKELLYAICTEGNATNITSSAFVKKYKLKSASAVQSAAKGLLAAEMIARNGEEYTISDPMLRIWLLSEIL